MYPFKGGSTIVRNRWYIAAFSSEVTREPMERTLLETPVVMYRTEAGAPVAMYGLCPHRYYPLAKGEVRGDAIYCGYHGFGFGDNGKCIFIPAQGTSAGFVQPTYRLEERGPLIWIWLGDESLCDPDLIPPYDDFGLDQPGWHASSFNYFHLNGRYQLLIDNLMDLTHLPYIHSHIEGGDVMKSPQMRQEDRAKSYRLDRITKSGWIPVFDKLYGREARFSGTATAVARTDFYGPEFIKTGWPLFTDIDDQDELPEGLGAFWILHGITPETATTTHYFGFATRNFRLGDAALDEFQLHSDQHIRQQDVDAIEAVEHRLDAAAAFQTELLAKSDGPAVKIRRQIQAMLDRENEAAQEGSKVPA